MTLYPAFLELKNQSVLVVGGGNVGLRKVQGLLEAGAAVKVVSPQFLPEFDDLKLEKLKRVFESSDLNGVVLVFACTDSNSVNDEVAQLAFERGIFCNHASSPENGNLRLGAVHRAGGTVAAFSSGKELPLLAQALRDTYAMALPTNLGRHLEHWEAARTRMLGLEKAERKAAMERLKLEIRDTLLPDETRAEQATCVTAQTFKREPANNSEAQNTLKKLEPDLMVIGLNHKTAPLAIRERVGVREEELKPLLEHLRRHAGEVTLLSTCNRTEVYLAGVQGDPVSAFKGGWGVNLRPYLYQKSGLEAVAHLYRVSSGLDSLVLGETQIQGQVKRAWQSAFEAGYTGPLLNKIFQSALEAGKTVRSSTGISDVAVSVSYAAVQLAERILGGLEGKTALVVGAGETAELTLTHLRSKGIGEVYVVNRTVERARKLAEQWGGKACAVETLAEVLPHADVVIASSSAPHYVIQPHRVAEALEGRPERPMFLIDISVPRIIDPEVGHQTGAYLYNLDDLTRIVGENLEDRTRKLPKAEKVISERLERFEIWLEGYSKREILKARQLEREALVQDELEKALNRLPSLNEHGRKVFEETLKRLATRVEMGEKQEAEKSVSKMLED